MKTKKSETKDQAPASLRAFHGDPAIKKKYLARIRKHRKLDQLIRGTGWDAHDSRGCAVGCTLNKYEHAAYETELGIPLELAYLEDEIFENLPHDLAMAWPDKFLKAIPVGADLSKIGHLVTIWQWEHAVYGLSQIDEVRNDAEVMKICEDLVALSKRVVGGDNVTQAEWLAIEQRARAGARVWAGAWAWAGARARVWAGAWARARVRVWAWARAVDQKDYVVLSEMLLELLSHA